MSPGESEPREVEGQEPSVVPLTEDHPLSEREGSLSRKQVEEPLAEWATRIMDRFMRRT